MSKTANLLNDLINKLATGSVNSTQPTEAEVFKGFTDTDAKEEAETHSRIDAKVRARRGEG